MTWRWGIVGPGRIAGQFAAGMSSLSDGVITAVASRSQSRADDFGDRYGVANRYGDLKALVEDPEVDVVYVATPQSEHAEVALAALDAGKHVLCEKPMALSARQVGEMTQRARSNGLFLMEAMWSRFLPSYFALRDILATGRLGEPLVVEADFGFRAPVSPDHRLFNPALGGGALLDLGIYAIQLCSMVFGGPPYRIAADGVVGSTGVDEKVAAVLQYPSNGLGVSRPRYGSACRAPAGSPVATGGSTCPRSCTVLSTSRSAVGVALSGWSAVTKGKVSVSRRWRSTGASLTARRRVL
ncbi:MAG: Gfo/Idh/MocA family oxidoreductase [Acidimicrobiales bacterium]